MTPESSTPGLAELTRQVRDVLTRFEGLANKLDTQFVNKDIFNLHSESVGRELKHLSDSLDRAVAAEKERSDRSVAAEKERNDYLEKRIARLEANNTWLVRVVGTAIIVAILAALGISNKVGGGG